MANFKKALPLKIIIIILSLFIRFLYPGFGFCLPEDYGLRPPLRGSLSEEAIDFINERGNSYDGKQYVPLPVALLRKESQLLQGDIIPSIEIAQLICKSLSPGSFGQKTKSNLNKLGESSENIAGLLEKTTQRLNGEYEIEVNKNREILLRAISLTLNHFIRNSLNRINGIASNSLISKKLKREDIKKANEELSEIKKFLACLASAAEIRLDRKLETIYLEGFDDIGHFPISMHFFSMKLQDLSQGSANIRRLSAVDLDKFDPRLFLDDEFSRELTEVWNFGAETLPTNASIIRRDLVAAVYPKVILQISKLIKQLYPDAKTDALGAAITIQGSTAKGLAIDQSDIEIRLLVDDTVLGPAIKIDPQYKQEMIVLVLDLLNEVIDKETLTVRRFSLKTSRAHKVTFMSEIINNPVRPRHVKAIADIFYVNIGNIEPMRYKALKAIISLEDPERKWSQIRKQWASFLRVSLNKHKDRVYSENASIESLSLPDLKTICKIYNVNPDMVDINIIDPNEYDSYVATLADIARVEEVKYQREDIDEETKAELRLTVGSFSAISKKLAWGDAEVLFSATDYKGEVLGARIICKPRYMETKKIGLKAVTGYDVVKHKYQHKGIGTALRKTAFEWMIDQGYYTYLGIIDRDNIKSLHNLKKVCREMGFTIQPISEDSEQYEKYYLIDLLAPRAPLQTLLRSARPLDVNL